MTCSTRIFPSFGKTRSTRPCLPLSRPVMTLTVSFLLMSTLCVSIFSRFSSAGLKPDSKIRPFFGTAEAVPFPLQNLWSQGNDLQKLFLAQLAGHGTEDARSDRLARLIDKHGGVLVEADVRPVPAAGLFRGAHEDALHYCAFFGGAIRRSFLHGSGENVAQVRRKSNAAAERQDDLQLASPRV